MKFSQLSVFNGNFFARKLNSAGSPVSILYISFKDTVVLWVMLPADSYFIFIESGVKVHNQYSFALHLQGLSDLSKLTGDRDVLKRQEIKQSEKWRCSRIQSEIHKVFKIRRL